MAAQRAEGTLGDAASKLALRLGEKSILRRVVEAALASPVDEVVVVLGHGAAELAQELPHDPRVRSIYNPDFAAGQSSSLKAGINAITFRGLRPLHPTGHDRGANQPLRRGRRYFCSAISR